MDCGYWNLTNIDVTPEMWVRLNFDAISTEAVQQLVGDNFEDFEHINGGETCENCSGTGQVEVAHSAPAEYPKDDDEEWLEDEDCPACDGNGRIENDLHGYPAAWGTMFVARDHNVLISALEAAGFEVYRPSGDIPLDGIVFGIDGGGYDFYSAHWIPLRAHIIKALKEDSIAPLDEGIFLSCMKHFADDCDKRVANGREEFLRRMGL